MNHVVVQRSQSEFLSSAFARQRVEKVCSHLSALPLPLPEIPMLLIKVLPHALCCGKGRVFAVEGEIATLPLPRFGDGTQPSPFLA